MAFLFRDVSIQVHLDTTSQLTHFRYDNDSSLVSIFEAFAGFWEGERVTIRIADLESYTGEFGGIEWRDFISGFVS